jgi:hypothetical protein
MPPVTLRYRSLLPAARLHIALLDQKKIHVAISLTFCAFERRPGRWRWHNTTLRASNEDGDIAGWHRVVRRFLSDTQYDRALVEIARLRI